MADFTNPYDAYIGGKSQSQQMAAERAQRIIQEITARRKNEMISSDLQTQELARKLQQAQLDAMPERNRIEALKAQAYADQVKAQKEAYSRTKPFDEARAQDLNAQNAYGPLSAIKDMMGKDTAGAAASYDRIKDSLPQNIRAVLERQSPSTFMGPGGTKVESTFNPDSIGALLEAANRSKSVTSIQNQEAKNQAMLEKANKDNETKLAIAQLKTATQQAVAEAKATGQSPKTFEAYVVQLIQSGTIDYGAGKQAIEEVRAAAALNSASQDKPQTVIPGLDTETPRERRNQGQLADPLNIR